MKGQLQMTEPEINNIGDLWEHFTMEEKELIVLFLNNSWFSDKPLTVAELPFVDAWFLTRVRDYTASWTTQHQSSTHKLLKAKLTTLLLHHDLKESKCLRETNALKANG